MTAETLLNELHKVRKNGNGSWMGCCPAHDDKSPSLSVTEGSDGHILIHCHAGCSPYEVLSSVGLSMSDLFPERDQHSYNDQPPPERKRETRSEANLAHIQLRHLTAEAMVENGHRLSSSEQKTALDDFKYLKEAGKLP